MKYYLIQAYKKEEDTLYKGHIYPSYLTSYKMTIGGEGFGLQSNFVDALKFKDPALLPPYLKKAVESFGDSRTFEIVEFDGLVFGKLTPRFIVKENKNEK